MCNCVKNGSNYKVINEVSMDCVKSREWQDGKYFCLKNDCEGCAGYSIAVKSTVKPVKKQEIHLFNYVIDFNIRKEKPKGHLSAC